jgi:hypothetical protein
MHEKFVQEACIGYNYGTMISVGIADIRAAPPGQDSEMSEVTEEAKEGLSFLETMNF